MKSSSVFFKNKFNGVFKSPFFYLVALLMLAGSAVSYFARTRFFSPQGTSSLTAYFSFIPFLSIILVPAFCLKKDSPYDSFAPLSPLKKLVINFIANFSSFGIILFWLLWMPVFVNFYGDVDIGSCFVSFFVLIFYEFSAFALCFFISEIFEKKVTAFVVSALCLSFANYIHLVPQYVSLPGIVSDFCYSIGFSGRFDSASKGIFASSDLFFFILSSLFFLFLSYVISENKKGRKYSGIELNRLWLTGILFLLLFCNNQKFFFRIDFSSDRIFSVSSYSKRILKENCGDITIHYFKSGKLESLYPSVKNVKEYLKDYSNASKNVSLKITDCDKDEKARDLLNSYGISPQRIRTENSTSTEFIDVYSSVVLEASGSIEVIPFVLSPSSLEYQLDLKLLKLVDSFEPEVKIICANDMTLEDDLRLLNDWFKNQDISVLNISPDTLEEEFSFANGPVFVFGEELLSKTDVLCLEDYVKSGRGSVLFLNSPFSVNLKEDWNVTENKDTPVTALLSNYDLLYKPSMVMDLSCQRISMMSDDSSSEYAQILNYPLWLDVLPQTNTKLGVNMFWVSPLELAETSVPLLLSSSYSYEENLNFDNEVSLIETNPFKVKMQNVQTNTVQNSIIAAYIPIECKENVYTKCGFYVISDQYFASYYTNGFIGGENGDFRNFIFLTGLFWKMNGNEELANLQGKTNRDTSLYKKTLTGF